MLIEDRDLHRLHLKFVRMLVLISVITFLSGLLILLSGCGHSMFHKVEGTGLYGRIPTPNGGSLIEVAIGDMTITSGILRGGAVYDDNGSKGGTFGSVSLGRRTYMATSPALTEGNIRDVLMSPDTDPATKQILASYLVSRKEPTPPPSATTAVNAGAATGGDKAPEAKPTRTGVDHITSTVGEAAPKVVDTVAGATTDVVDTVADTAGGMVNDVATTVTDVSNDWSNLWIWVGIGVIVVLVVGVVVLILYRKKKQK